MSANISNPNPPEEEISRLFSLIGQPARIKILWVIAEQAACVCHLEAALGLRQASISQHLMVLRKAGLVAAHRDGRNIFYHLVRPEVMEVLGRAASLMEGDPEVLHSLTIRPIPNCPCPQCNPCFNPKSHC